MPILWLMKHPKQTVKNPLSKTTFRLIKESAQGAAHRSVALIQTIREQRRLRKYAWSQEEAKWQHSLSGELDASIGKLTYNDAFTKYGQPQMTIINRPEVIAVYQSGRFKTRRYPISHQGILSCFPHGSRLELRFDDRTRLVSWKYTEW
jgi:hypothetical protein